MPSRLEDYALLGDTRTAALVGADGSVDWLCLPRFDSPACFAALLGDERHGRWLLAPAGGVLRTHQRYLDDTLVVETVFETVRGTVRVVDGMLPGGEGSHLLRRVEGVSGRVPVRMQLVIRFDYGSIVPWVRNLDGALSAVAGPDALILRSDVATRGEGFTTVAELEVEAGDRATFALAWHPSHEPPPAAPVPDALERAMAWWSAWAGCARVPDEHPDAVLRSLLTLKALTFSATGGIVAAPTTSLPERLGGGRNWDYRYCWLRDATFALDVLLLAGYTEEAVAWRDWLLRAVAGRPADLQIMYGLSGERRLDEHELPWLPGYEASAPVRVGNAASRQLQLDVFGELLDAMFLARRFGVPPEAHAREVERVVLDWLEGAWREPDDGIWEVRGPRRHFTHSKVMAWTAFDRAIRTAETSRDDGPVERWRRIRDEIHAEVCERGYDADRRTFVQSYGSGEIDASLLLLPLVGFLPACDDRVRGTVAAVERELVSAGLVHRYRSGSTDDGLAPGEGAFLPCSFWLTDNHVLAGDVPRGRAIFERVLALRGRTGLLSEQYEVTAGRLVGNHPQALSHIGVVHSASLLARGSEATPRRAP
ncbi:MAG: glycoside hydrolase family 15 protein [Acidimicrobiia bacterium]|nr:glycoside hydrolase family 15 protein [Acidimicrobiia bacterium]